MSEYHSGMVAIIGRPNVGKSTLMNRILEQKISITSHKPQTTRHRILGIKTTESCQAVYVDTPGVHLQVKNAMNRMMNRTATATLDGVDVILFVIDALQWTAEDEALQERLKSITDIPVLVVLNKIDRLKKREDLFPLLQKVGEAGIFQEVLPLSAAKGENVQRLESVVCKYLPEMPAIYPEEQLTDRSERFLAAEIIREKLMRRLDQEIPYNLTVEIESFKEQKGILRIHGLIWVERPSQKSIIIGKGGEQLKETGRQAREDMEKLFDNKVFLQLWVKVREGWLDNERLLRSLGYGEDEY